MTTYFYHGHKTVGSYIARQLDGSFQQVDSIDDAAIVITYCTHASAVEDAYFDDEGIIKCARRNALLIDLSASSPSLSREISAVATVNDLRCVEAPLAVLDAAAPDAFSDNANIACYASGEADDVLAAREVLDKLAGFVKYTGASGTAQLAKAMHTTQACAQFMGIVEADALRTAVEKSHASIKSSGTDIEPLSSISAHALEAIDSKRYEGTYTVEMIMADVVAAMTTADDAEIILPQLEATMNILEVLAVIGGADLSPTALALIYRDEDESAKAGLDWTRAENLFLREEVHDHDHGESGFDFDDYDDYDDFDDFENGFQSFGFGGYAGYGSN